MTSFDLPDNDSNIPNREELLQMAIRAAKAGNREGARVMLRKVLSEDRRNERAMLWMAKIATNKTERRQWLNRILVVNPNQQSAKDALRRMDYKSSARDNRVLIVFGVVALVMIVVAIVIVLGLASGR
jgi:thioredoxin-like negative regulator of GroEL